MASHQEMSRLAGDPVAVRALAASLLQLRDTEWSEWEREFLDGMATWTGPEHLSERQREKLFELRDDGREYRTIGGMSVALLVRRCWEARLDLEEEQQEYIERLYARGEPTLKRRPLEFILHCARQLHLVDHYVRVG